MTSYAHLFQNLIVKLAGLACHSHNLQTKLIHIYLQNDPGTHKLDPPSLHMVSRHWQTGCFLEIPNQTINIQLQQILHIHLLCTPMHWIQTQQNIMQWHLLQKLSRSRHSNRTWVFNFPVGHYQLNSSYSSLRIFLGIRLNHAMSSDGVRWLWESISIFYKVHFWMTKRCIWIDVKLTLEKPFYIF